MSNNYHTLTGFVEAIFLLPREVVKARVIFTAGLNNNSSSSPSLSAIWLWICAALSSYISIFITHTVDYRWITELPVRHFCKHFFVLHLVNKLEHNTILCPFCICKIIYIKIVFIFHSFYKSFRSPCECCTKILCCNMDPTHMIDKDYRTNIF